MTTDAFAQSRIAGAQQWLDQWSKPRDQMLISPLAAWQAGCQPEPSASALAAALAAAEQEPVAEPAPKAKRKGVRP